MLATNYSCVFTVVTTAIVLSCLVWSIEAQYSSGGMGGNSGSMGGSMGSMSSMGMPMTQGGMTGSAYNMMPGQQRPGGMAGSAGAYPSTIGVYGQMLSMAPRMPSNGMMMGSAGYSQPYGTGGYNTGSYGQQQRQPTNNNYMYSG